MQNGRWYAGPLERDLRRPFVHVVFGARQTGKSTLLRSLLGETSSLWLDLAEPGMRSAYLANPQRFVEECLALPKRRAAHTVVVDEVQAVPALFDAVQSLYDRDQKRFRFVLSGSSARKLRVAGTNLLPGRAIFHRLHPLMLMERPAAEHEGTALVKPEVSDLRGAVTGGPVFPPTPLIDRLAFGELPGIALAAARDRAPVLRAYSHVYLEEELRREALIKDWATFARFLQLAALESGQTVNYAKVAKDAGVSAPTAKSHYQLLEDMFVGFHLPAFSGSLRKHVLSTPRFYLFDLGVRHAAAGLENHRNTVLANPGPLLEHWVALELHKRLSYAGKGRLSYYRTKAGAEVDFIVEQGRNLVPIEVKWTDNPDRSDARHLIAFMADHKARAPKGYVVCRTERRREIAPGITAIPWWQL